MFGRKKVKFHKVRVNEEDYIIATDSNKDAIHVALTSYRKVHGLKDTLIIRHTGYVKNLLSSRTKSQRVAQLNPDDTAERITEISLHLHDLQTLMEQTSTSPEDLMSHIDEVLQQTIRDLEEEENDEGA